MRVKMTSNGLTAQAIAGAHVVLLGFNMPRGQCDGLLGFGVHRTDDTEHEAYWMEGLKTFADTDPGLPLGSKYPTNKHPIQGFTWSDFTAKPGRHYTYLIQAFKGTPQSLDPVAEVSLEVATESPEGGDHDVFFNRGAAASQEYARRFGNRKPGASGGDADPAWAWLSRGAEESILGFIARAQGKSWGLRVSAYEFRLPSVLNALRDAHLRHADVHVLFDAGSDFPRDDNREQAAKAKIKSLCSERVPKPSALSHHKFIVLLKDHQPIAVLTGSTNFSTGGVFGQSNVVHVVEEPAVAQAYLDCWEAIRQNPEKKVLAPKLTMPHPLSDPLPPVGTTSIFSPRQSIDALEWYGRLAGGAKDGLFMTFAFGMHSIFQDVYSRPFPGLRYALMDKLLGPGVRKERKAAETARMVALRKMVENRFAVGNRIRLNAFDRWMREALTGLNTHVEYIHTKYMLVDPLGDDPVVVTGSANFSAASSNKNDENMLVIRGNRRVSEIYLGEFMRLWNHYAFREFVASHPDPTAAPLKHLDTGNQWWKAYFGSTDRSRQREYFSR